MKTPLPPPLTDIKPRLWLLASLALWTTLLHAETPPETAHIPVAAPSSTPQDIRYCETISEKLHLYANSEELFADLTIKAQTKALQDLLKSELAQFESNILSMEDFYTALLHIVDYSEAKRISEGLLTPCIELTASHVSAEHRQRFTAIEIGRVCSYNANILEQEVARIKKGLVDTLFTSGKEPAQPEILAKLLSKADKIANKHGKKLTEVVHERDTQPGTDAVTGTACKALMVYPIELYALSVPYAEASKEKTARAKAKAAFEQLAAIQAHLHGLDPALFRALVQQESNWRASIVSHKGAVGLAQIMPATAKMECNLDKTDLHNPRKNLSCGARYLAKQLKNYRSVEAALCAYNAGPGTVLQGRCQDIRETRHYVRNVVKMMGEIEQTQEQSHITDAIDFQANNALKSDKS